MQRSRLQAYRAMRRDLIERVYLTLKEASSAHGLTVSEVIRWTKHEARYKRVSQKELFFVEFTRWER